GFESLLSHQSWGQTSVSAAGASLFGRVSRKLGSDPDFLPNKEKSMQQAVQNTPSPLERNITVSVPIEQIEAEIATRLKKLARTVKMQGFRPGKVPLKMVERQYGFQVRQEV